MMAGAKLKNIKDNLKTGSKKDGEYGMIYPTIYTTRGYSNKIILMD